MHAPRILSTLVLVTMMYFQQSKEYVGVKTIASILLEMFLIFASKKHTVYSFRLILQTLVVGNGPCLLFRKECGCFVRIIVGKESMETLRNPLKICDEHSHEGVEYSTNSITNKKKRTRVRSSATLFVPFGSDP